jgi:hypothetical protein
MKKYRQLNSPICEAVQWFKHGDHPEVKHAAFAQELCDICGQGTQFHGWIEHPDGGDGFSVCPSNFVLFTDHFYPLPAEVFLANYVPLASGDEQADLSQSLTELLQVIETLRERNRGSKKAVPERGHAIFKMKEASHWLRDAVDASK